MHALCVRVGSGVCPGGYAYVYKTLGNVAMSVKKNLAAVLLLMSVNSASYGRVVLQEKVVAYVPPVVVPLPVGGVPMVVDEILDEELTSQERYQKAVRLIRSGYDLDAIYELLECGHNEFCVEFLLGLLYQYNSIDDDGITAPQTWSIAQEYFERAVWLLWRRMSTHALLYLEVKRLGYSALLSCKPGSKLTGRFLYNALCAQPCLYAAWKKVLMILVDTDPVLAFDISLYVQYMDGLPIKRIMQEILRVEAARVVIAEDEVIE